MYEIRWLMNRSFPLSLCVHICWYLPCRVQEIIRNVLYTIHYTPILCTKYFPLLSESLLFHVVVIFTMTFRHILLYWLLGIYASSGRELWLILNYEICHSYLICMNVALNIFQSIREGIYIYNA